MSQSMSFFCEPPNLSFNSIKRRLRQLEKNQSQRRQLQYLVTKLGTDRPAGSRHHDDLPLDARIQ